MNCPKRVSGFTLVEVLIAVGISSLIIVSIYSAFYTGALSANKSDASFEVYHSARTIFNRLELDLKNSFRYQVTDSKFKGALSEMRFFSVVDGYARGEPYSALGRLEYAFRGNSLVRILAKGMDALKEDSPGEEEELCAQVKLAEFRFLCPNPKADPQNPYLAQEVWPSQEEPGITLAQQAQMPTAVEVKLVIFERSRPGQESPVEFTRIITLPQGID